MQSIRDLFTFAYNTLRRDGVAVQEGPFHICERLRFVRLPSSLLPQSNARISLTGSKGDNRRLLRFWPCIVYETLDELLNHVQGADKDKVLNHHKSKAPVKVVARLIAWKDRPVESPKLLLRPDNISSCGGYDLGEVTLVHLSGDSLGQNEEEDHGELLGFFDSQYELEDLMNGVISELGMHLYDKSSNDLYTHARRFRTAVDLTLNLLAESLGADPLPLREPTNDLCAPQLVTPLPRKRSREHIDSRKTLPTMPTPSRPTKQNKSSSKHDSLDPMYNPGDIHQGGLGDKEGHGDTNTEPSKSMDDEMPCGDPHDLGVTNLHNTPSLNKLSNPDGPGAPRKPRRNESLASQGDSEVNENLLNVFDTDGNEGLEPVAREDVGETRSIATNSYSASRTDDSVEGQASVTKPSTSSLNTTDSAPSPNNDDALADDLVCDPCVDEVESQLSSVSQGTPSPQVNAPKGQPKKRKSRTKGSKKTRSKKGTSTAMRRDKAKKSKSGSRLVWNKNSTNPTTTKSRNDRTCLIDAVHALLSADEQLKAATVYKAMESKLAPEGDTSIESVNEALTEFGMELLPVTGQYRKKGGLPYHLLQEQECKLVINIKLTNTQGQTMNHSVAWDGNIIHDHPKICIVNRTTDREYWDSSNAVFHKLYPKKFFSSWQITNVFLLETFRELD